MAKVLKKLAKAQSTVDGKHDSSTKYLHLLLAQIVASDFATREILACGGGGANAMPSSNQLGSEGHSETHAARKDRGGSGEEMRPGANKPSHLSGWALEAESHYPHHAASTIGPNLQWLP